MTHKYRLVLCKYEIDKHSQPEQPLSLFLIKDNPTPEAQIHMHPEKPVLRDRRRVDCPLFGRSGKLPHCR